MATKFTFQEVLSLIDKVDRISIIDYENFEYGLAYSGGKYIEYTDFVKTKNNKWEVYYGTSCGISDFCSKCGAFHEEEKCPASRKVISKKELIERLKHYFNSEYTELEFFKGDRAILKLV